MRTTNGNGTRNPLRACSTALSLLIACALTGCGSPRAGSTDEKPSQPSQPAILPAPISVDLTLFSTGSFDAFIYKDSLWVRGSHPIDLLLDSPADFVRYARNTNPQPEWTPMTGIWVRDNTVCFSTYVNPVPGTYFAGGRAAGDMTFCFGPATLSGASSNLIRFSSPPFSSADLPDAVEAPVLLPYVGANMTLADFESGGYMVDSASTVSQQTLSCSDDGTKLTCPTFEVIYE